MKITPFSTEPCDLLRAIGDELGLETKAYILNGIIVDRLADFFDQSESNCIWHITKTIPMAVAIKASVLSTRILVGPFDKPYNSYSDTKRDTDISFLFKDHHLNQCNTSYELADPCFIDKLKQYIKNLKLTYHSLE